MLSSSAYAMNLNEALSSTYDTNKELGMARQKFLTEIESFPEALAGFLPDLSARISATNSKQKGISELSQSRESQRAGPDGTKTLTITQEVFSGGRSMYGLKSAQSGFWVSRTTLYNQEQKILTEAAESYLNVASAKAKYEIAQDSLDFYQKNLHMVEEKLKVGESTLTEVSLARSNVAQAQAVKSKNFAELLAANANFKTMTNLEATDDMNFPELPQKLPENLAEFEGRVMKTNLDLISAKHQLKQRKDISNGAKGALLPRASLQFQAEKKHFRDEVQSSFLSQSERQKKFSSQTSVVIDIPIFHRGGADYAKIRKANKSARQAVYALDQAEKKVKENTISVWEAY